MTKKQQNCKHDWSWDVKSSRSLDVIELSGDDLGIPQKCNLCGLEAIEWWTYSCVRDKNYKLIS